MSYMTKEIQVIQMANVRIFKIERLLELWKTDDEELTLSEIKKRAHREFSSLRKRHPRTFIRYLNQLLEKGLLDKRVDTSHQSYYKKTESGLRRTLILHIQDDLEVLSYETLWKIFFLIKIAAGEEGKATEVSKSVKPEFFNELVAQGKKIFGSEEKKKK